MTRDEYVKWLKQLDESLKFDGLIDGDKAVDLHEMIFDLCEMLEQQTCEDAVSRKVVLDNIDAKLWEYCTYLSKYNGGIGQRHASALANIIREAISELPSVQIELKTGHWIRHVDDWEWWECSECHCNRVYGNEFCPDCGSHNGDVRR